MATFTGTGGADNFQGSADGDVFVFNIANFAPPDIVNGGGSATDPLDQLRLTGMSDPVFGLNFVYFEHQFPVFPFYSDITSIEQVYLSVSGTSVSFTNTFLNSSSTGTVEIFGTGTGADVISLDGSYRYAPRTGKVIVHAGAGNDQIWSYFGGVAAANDVLDGGSGDDIIVGRGTLLGGDGNDELIPIGSNDKAYGGAGDDIFSFPVPTLVDADKVLTIDGGDGFDELGLGGLGRVQLTLSGIEAIKIEAFSGAAADYVELAKYNSLIQPTIGSPTTLRVKDGGTFDMRTISNGAFDTKILVDDSYASTVTTTIFGTAGQNIVVGGYGSDIIYGGNLSDDLDGGAGGTDTIYGGGGNDKLRWTSFTNLNTTLFGDLGNDSFFLGGFNTAAPSVAAYGGAGNDAFILGHIGSFTACKIDGGAGVDLLKIGASQFTQDISRLDISGIETIVSASALHATLDQIQQLSSLNLTLGQLFLTGSGVLDLSGKLTTPNKDLTIRVSAAGNVTLTSSVGNDAITADHSTSSGNTVVDGGDGNDRIVIHMSSAWSSHDVANGGNGDDYMFVVNLDSAGFPGGSFASLNGGLGNDTFGFDPAASFDGGDGMDTLEIANQTLDAANISNIEVLNIKSVFLDAGIADLAQFQAIKLTPGSGITPANWKLNLELIGDGAVDLTGKMVDYSVDMSFSGQTRGVSAIASDYDDIVRGTLFGDVLSGGLGNDEIRAGNGHDTARGGAGNDIIFGELGNDRLYGGEGNDALDGETGADFMYGGAGDDWYTVDNAGDVVDEQLESGAGIDLVRVVGGIGFNLSDKTHCVGLVENLILFGTARNGTGNAVANQIIGNDLNNIFLGLAGDDTLIGNGGGDTLDGGTGNDTMQGGAGNDIYYVYGAGDVVDEAGATGIDTVRSFATFRLTNTTQIFGDVENIELLGAANVGAVGNALANSITGNSGNNVLIGGAGNDRLAGDLGSDRLTGGEGRDLFLFRTELNIANNVDTLTDFAHVSDKIGLENGIFTQLTTTGLLNASNFAANATGAAGDGNDFIVYNTTTGDLFYDADGSGAGSAIRFATLLNHPATIFAGDFIVM